MDTKSRARRPRLPESTDSPAQRIVAIRGFQMPQDIRSVFHPEDVILFYQPRHGGGSSSRVGESQARARQRLSRDVVCRVNLFPWLHSLARLVLSPSSLFLLQQPIRNMKSFIRYYRFFGHGQAGGPADQDVDSCIRSHLAEGILGRVPGLFEEGCALLGLIPRQDRFALSGFGFARLGVLRRTFHDWKRWRLSALLCRRLQARGGVWLEPEREVDIVDRLEGSGRRKWLLVDSRLFSSKSSSRPRGTVASESPGHHLGD